MRVFLHRWFNNQESIIYVMNTIASKNDQQFKYLMTILILETLCVETYLITYLYISSFTFNVVVEGPFPTFPEILPLFESILRPARIILETEN